MEKAGQRLPISAGSKSVESASDSRPEISRGKGSTLFQGLTFCQKKEKSFRPVLIFQIRVSSSCSEITPLQRPRPHRMLSGGVSQAHAPGLLSILRCRTVIPTCTAPNVSSPLALGLRLRVPTREGALVPRWFLKPFPFPHLSVALLLCRFSSFGWHLPWL